MYVLFSIRILELIKSRSNYLKQATGGWHSVRVERNFYKSLTEINQKYFIVKCFILFLHFTYHHYITRLFSKLTWNGSLSIVIKQRHKKLQRFFAGNLKWNRFLGLYRESLGEKNWLPTRHYFDLRILYKNLIWWDCSCLVKVSYWEGREGPLNILLFSYHFSLN